MSKRGTLRLILLLALFLGVAGANESDVYWLTRREAVSNSKVLETLHLLTDRYGPRLTGSPSLEDASRWAVEQLTAWGLENARLEPWDFGHPGWANERLTAHIVAPVKDVLTAEVPAWTPGTDGPVRATVTQIELPRLPTKDALERYLASIADGVRDKIVLTGEHELVPVAFDQPTMRRLLVDGPVELEVAIENHFYPEGKTAYNVVAKIPGTDKADEVVMLSAHLDSWHAWTGATDNAIGCSVMMEAVRVLKAIRIEPRRTIRVAVWSGEEQGLLGSKAYVAEHFGTFEDSKPGFEKFGGYFNLDAGTGQVRGATVFGPSPAAEALREALLQFEDLGVLGATTTDSRTTGRSDHTSFNGAGLPGISMEQDPIEYGSHSWHTNLDAFERVVEFDAQSSAIVIASVYHLAVRDELLPRFSRETMPEPPKRDGGEQSTQP